MKALCIGVIVTLAVCSSVEARGHGLFHRRHSLANPAPPHTSGEGRNIRSGNHYWHRF